MDNHLTQEYYKRAKKLIPGGTQLLSKRPEMFLPEQWPAYYQSARGVEVVDLDGLQYIDMGMMGIGACVLGYADSDVDNAVKQAIDKGVQCTLNPPEEVELAELLCELHPWADMARFTRSGGEAMAVAVRIARAATGRDKIAFCGYHGWSDWYLAANLHSGTDGLQDLLMPGLEPRGVPQGLYGSSLPFHYNNFAELSQIVKDNGGNSIAAIVMEPQRGKEPAPGFLEAVRDLASEIGAVLIYDEITTGFRVTVGGIHLKHAIEPDMAVFAKAIANGYAMGAIIGRREIMDAAQSSFISSTNWTERLGPVAALATIKKMQKNNVCLHVADIGEKWQKIIKTMSSEIGLAVTVDGLPALSHFSFCNDDNLEIMSLFTKLMLEQKYLSGSQFKPSYAHRVDHLDDFANVAEQVMKLIAVKKNDGGIKSSIGGAVARRGFYRLT